MARLLPIAVCAHLICGILNTNALRSKNLGNIFGQSQHQIPESCNPYSITVDDEIKKARIKLQSNVNSSDTMVNCEFRLNHKIIENCIAGNIFIISSATKGRSLVDDIIIFECSASFAVDVDYNGVVPHKSINIEYSRQGASPGEQGEAFQKYTVEVNFHLVPDVSGKYTFFSILNRDVNKVDIFLRVKSKEKVLFNEGDTLSAWKDNNYLIIPCRAFDRQVSLTLAKVVNENEEFAVLSDSSVKYDPEIGFSFDIDSPNSSHLIGEEYICWRTNSSNKERRSVFVKFSAENLTRPTNPEENGPVIWFKSSTRGRWNEAAYCESQTSSSVNFINIESFKSRTESILKTNCLRSSKDYECNGRKDSERDWTQRFQKFRIIIEVWLSGLLICTSPMSAPTAKEYFVGFDKNIHTELRPSHLSRDKVLKIELFRLEDTIYDRQPVENFFSEKDYLICFYFVEYVFMYYNYPLCYFQNTQNQTLEKVLGETEPQNNFEGFSFWIFKVKFPNSKVAYVTCSVSFWNYQLGKLDAMNITKNVIIADRVNATIQIENKNPVFVLNDTGRGLNCKSNGIPVPKMNWTIQGKFNESIPVEMGTTETSSDGFISLLFPAIKKIHEANFTCTSKNELGTYSETVFVRVLEKATSDAGFLPRQNSPSDTNYGLLVGLPISVTVMMIGAFIIIFYCYMQHHKKNLVPKEEVDLFFIGEAPGEAIKDKGDLEYIPNIAYDKKYEISDEDFTLDKESLLGSGQFGIVYKGVVRSQQVAVKTVSKFAKLEHVKALLSELKLMIYIGEHPNIPVLIGAHTRSISKGLVYMFVELCPLGSLETYMRKNRTNFISKEPESRYCNTHESLDLDSLMTITDLINWSYQTANAMEFLSGKKVIHGDLATRNILLFDKSWIKVTDFGLSRKLYEYTNYVKTSQEPLPWRWLAVESLKDMHFSSKTDVWSYGVTVWEIFSLGEVPYGGLSWHLDFPNKLKQGLRLLKPEYASVEMYEILKQCWCDNPEQRPPFSQLSALFQRLLSTLNAEVYTDLSVRESKRVLNSYVNV